MSNERTILITGGAGFIGSHVVRRFVNKYPHYRIINLDALTYAGNLENLRDVENASNYTFVKCDIRDAEGLTKVFAVHEPDGVIHLAAESHVDRSISDPMALLATNVIGTVTLLNAARASWHSSSPAGGGRKGVRFYHVSTDEVYGSLHDGGFFTEQTAYDPQSPTPQRHCFHLDVSRRRPACSFLLSIISSSASLGRPYGARTPTND